jgi:long-chain fatty acid transport protein
MTARFLAGVAAFSLAPAAAIALGLDRSGQPVDVLFEDGNYFEFGVGRAFPSLDGTDVPLFGGRDTGEVGLDYDQIGAGLKLDATDRLSFSFISGQPYGADISYPLGRSIALGGTKADVDSKEFNVLARYEVNERFSVHGGFRHTRLESSVTLSGLAYGGLSGYSASFEEDADVALIAGVAYEVPEIALRVALTYFQGTEHEFRTRETLGGLGVGSLPAAALGLPFNPFSTESTTTVETPDAVNLDFQTGLNQSTLLFGQLRYAWYGDTITSPPFFDALNEPTIPGSSLTEIQDSYSLEVGIGRKLTDRISGSVSFGYEPEDDDDLVSPLAPTNGLKSVGLGMSYAVTDQVTVAGGLRYVWLGDAFAETGTPDTARTTFDDNTVVGIGAEIGYRF